MCRQGQDLVTLPWVSLQRASIGDVLDANYISDVSHIHSLSRLLHGFRKAREVSLWLSKHSTFHEMMVLGGNLEQDSKL